MLQRGRPSTVAVLSPDHFEFILIFEYEQRPFVFEQPLVERFQIVARFERDYLFASARLRKVRFWADIETPLAIDLLPTDLSQLFNDQTLHLA